MVFGSVRVREGDDFSTLHTNLTGDPRAEQRVSCHYGNDLGELIPFRLIYNTAIIVAALTEIFPERWGEKKDGLYLS